MNKKRIEKEKKLYLEMQHYERLAREQGFALIAGVDEAGRGPLAGPVVAAVCILNPAKPIFGINDSKKLTPAKRMRLYQQILEDAVAWNTAAIDHLTIDKLNILEATRMAMHKAVSGLTVVPDLLLLDAVTLEIESAETWPIVKGDTLSVSVAAASILAKVTRDNLMHEYDELYPGYGFTQHKGYGTAAHYDALCKLGPSPIHRRTFLRSVAERLINTGLISQEFFADHEQ